MIIGDKARAPSALQGQAQVASPLLAHMPMSVPYSIGTRSPPPRPIVHYLLSHAAKDATLPQGDAPRLHFICSSAHSLLASLFPLAFRAPLRSAETPRAACRAS